jgi:hypothetical protein
MCTIATNSTNLAKGNNPQSTIHSQQGPGSHFKMRSAKGKISALAGAC